MNYLEERVSNRQSKRIRIQINNNISLHGWIGTVFKNFKK